MKKYVGYALMGAVTAALAGGMACLPERQTREAILRKAPVAEGYDVSLVQYDGGIERVIFGVGILETPEMQKIKNRRFRGPFIIARDYTGDGQVDKFFCTTSTLRECTYQERVSMDHLMNKERLNEIERMARRELRPRAYHQK